MRTIAIVLGIVLLALAVPQALAQEQQVFTWQEFLAQSIRHSAKSFNLDDIPPHDIILYLYSDSLPDHVWWAVAIFTLNGFQAGSPPEFIIKKVALDRRPITALRYQFWRRQEQRFVLRREVVMKRGDASSSDRIPIWGEDSPEMRELHDWFDTLVTQRKYRFLHLLKWEEGGGYREIMGIRSLSAPAGSP